MIVLVWPGFWLLLVPIILIEALVAQRVLKVPWRPALRLSAKANLISTLAGIPATWLALLAVQMLATGVLVLGSNIWGLGNEPPWVLVLLAPVTAAWIGPDQSWEVAAAAMWLCGAFFLISVWLERWVLKRNSDLSSIAIRRWSWEANILTYSMIEILLGGLLVWTLVAS